MRKICMAISIARVSSRSSREHEGKPRFRQLEFCGMRRRCQMLPACFRRNDEPTIRIARGQPRRNSLQGLPRRNLCASPLVVETTGCRLLKFGAGHGTLAPKTLEPGHVDTVEWQRGLKSLLRRRVQLTSRAQGAIAVEPQAVTLKTQRARSSGFGRVPAGRAKGPGTLALELAARKANPFFLFDLRGRHGHLLQHGSSVAERGDRGGHTG